MSDSLVKLKEQIKQRSDQVFSKAEQKIFEVINPMIFAQKDIEEANKGVFEEMNAKIDYMNN